MTDDAGLIQPNLALLSFIVSNPNAMHEPFEYSEQEIILYIGSTLAGVSRVGKLNTMIPHERQDCVKNCYRLRPRALVGQYTAHRYLILFDKSKAASSTRLLFDKDNRSETVSRLARSLVPPFANNLRRNRFTTVSPVDFSMITVVDVDARHIGHPDHTPAANVLQAEDAMRLATIVRQGIGQQGGLAFPSQHFNLIFSVGGAVGGPSESAVAARLSRPEPRETETSVPSAVVDWLNIVDLIEVIKHLTQDLDNTEIGRAAMANYIEEILAAHGESEFEDRYLKPREASLAHRIEFGEIVEEITRTLQSNVFGKLDPSYFRKLDMDPALPGLDFFAMVSSDLTEALKKFEVSQSRITSRDERISGYLRDVVGWRVTQASLGVSQASNRLAERMETLTKWLLLLAILTVLAALPTDEIKKKIYEWSGTQIEKLHTVHSPP